MTAPALAAPTTTTLRAAIRGGGAVRGPAPIPFSPGLPLLGSALEFRRDRLKLLNRMAALGPVARYDLGPVPVHVITDPDLAHDVLVDHADAFVKARGLSVFLRPLLGDGLLTSEGDVHRRQRKLLAPAFAHRRIASYGDIIAAEARRAVATWRNGEIIDAVTATMEMTLAVVGRALFSADVRSDADVVASAVTEAMEAMVQSITSPLQVPYSWPISRHRRMRRAVAALDEVVYRLIAEARATGVDRGDVLSMLLLARDEDDGTGMTDLQVRDEVMTLILAGHETTANGLAWALHALGRYPQARDRVEEEVAALGHPVTDEDLPRLPYTLMVIEEALRLWPPAYAYGRQVARDVELGGYHFPSGATVIVNVWGLHRRPDFYPEPEVFRPERWTPEARKARPRGSYLPFGAGPRVCIGNHFALLECHLALAVIASQVRLEPLMIAAPRPEPLVTLRPRGALMRVRRRDPM